VLEAVGVRGGDEGDVVAEAREIRRQIVRLAGHAPDDVGHRLRGEAADPHGQRGARAISGRP
jgi:hypothetical protein